MMVTKQALFKFCDKATYATHGDGLERELGPLITSAFAESEHLWQRLVVPLTCRMSGYPDEPSTDIWPRSEVSPDLRDWSQVHYSIFLHLAYAQRHRLSPDLCFLEDLYSHLGSTCDLAEEFMERSYLILADVRGDKIELLEELSKKDFLRKAEDLYDNSFSTWSASYRRKRKLPPIQILGKSPLVEEFLTHYLGRADLWTLWSALVNELRPLRNVLVHSPHLGRIVSPDNQPWIPRPKAVSRYKTWREIFTAAADPTIVQRDFVPAAVQTCTDIARVGAALNQLWAPLRQAFESELFEERDGLRQHYALEIR